MANYQKKLARCAIALLKPGGTMKYSTCTITALENEETVCYILESCPSITLVPINGCAGQQGLAGHGLNDSQRQAVRRFEPSESDDTMGFFLAKFQKIEAALMH